MVELRLIAERMASVVAAVVSSAGGKPPKFPPLPRPVVAMDRVWRRKNLERHHRLVSVLIPESDGPPAEEDTRQTS